MFARDPCCHIHQALAIRITAPEAAREARIVPLNGQVYEEDILTDALTILDRFRPDSEEWVAFFETETAREQKIPFAQYTSHGSTMSFRGTWDPSGPDFRRHMPFLF